MSDRMRPVPVRELLLRSLAEYRVKGSIFDIPEAHFWRPTPGRSAPIFSSRAANPVGPAAGPHTQLSQNIIAAWLAGGRYIELKTVQALDALTVEKPCIDAADEGYNVEWSTELSLEAAYEEYLKAWLLLHVFDALLGPADAAPAAPSFLFNMSVGYDLAGIKTEKMDRFITRLMDSSQEPIFASCQEELALLCRDPRLLEGTPWQEKAPLLRDLPARISPRICASVTLSTMHGCPPGEIESICAYMLREKKLDTLVKLNPTLLGHERARSMLSDLGYGYVSLKPEGFLKDLQLADAAPMLARLLALARREGRHFGAKLSNTLATANNRGVLPGAEMYMSGRALYPLTMNLAALLAAELKGNLPLSFSGGASAWNLGEILDAGIRPVTVATELLKPGGYARLKELAEIAEKHAGSWEIARVDSEALRRAAESARSARFARKDFRGRARVSVDGPLPLFDCFVAPCVQTCPICQDVPEYVHLAGAGRYREAFEAIYSRNPLPFMTGYLCDHQCTGNCTRMDWEGAVRIREIKRIAAERGYEAFRASGASRPLAARPRGVKVAVVGAGPAGLAAASFLCRDGFEVHVFEREKEPGGIVRYLLPGFRIPAGSIEKDVSLLRDLGARLHFGHPPSSVRALKARGFRYVLVGIGAEADKGIGIPGARPVLSFLRQFRSDSSGLRLGSSVAVVGAGDTAMDAARAAGRCPGVREVRIVYRRGEQEMPASQEEYDSAREEGVRFHFLRAPESWTPGKGLLCRVMVLGPADESGRSRPIATASTETIPADTVITAAGAEVDAQALAGLGLGALKPAVNPATQETAAAGVFLIGDAAQGAETIVKAIASARRAADAILSRESAAVGQGTGAPAWPLPAEDAAALRAARDRLIPASPPEADDAAACATESRRCLGCRALCMKCVEVCPNRANTIVQNVNGFRDEAQIVHIDAFCNECGNCATFCPWEGKPYRDKLTVFATEGDFRESANPGFFLKDGTGNIRIDGRIGALVVDSAGGVAADLGDRATLTVVQAIVRDHAYLLGGTS
ncbi:MAG: putative selenate reductase subunit YgfK [Spirochaetia bacterium]|jgi:putative selenate reductase